MPRLRPFKSICTPRAWPSLGKNSAYGNVEPIMKSVSQPFIRSHDALVPSRPMLPVHAGASSGSTALPRSALATPAPSRSAACKTSSAAPIAPAPTSIAIFWPAFSTAAARFKSSSRGITRGAA